MFGTSEQVDRHCRKNGKRWDSGEEMRPTDGKVVRCCVELKLGRRIRLWVTRGEEDCLAHEECHIEEFWSGSNNHGRCHNFGVGREIKRL